MPAVRRLVELWFPVAGPSRPHCHACWVGKLLPQQPRRSKELGPPPTNFGEQVTADHILSRPERSEGVTGDLDPLLIYGRATTWIDCYPAETQSTDDVYNTFINFIGPPQEGKHVNS